MKQITIQAEQLRWESIPEEHARRARKGIVALSLLLSVAAVGFAAGGGWGALATLWVCALAWFTWNVWLRVCGTAAAFGILLVLAEFGNANAGIETRNPLRRGFLSG